ncbi:MAG: hypothetical protein ABIL06_07645 [Pseudomonadota bacterium]
MTGGKHQCFLPWFFFQAGCCQSYVGVDHLGLHHSSGEPKGACHQAGRPLFGDVMYMVYLSICLLSGKRGTNFLKSVFNGLADTQQKLMGCNHDTL